ncbi:MAG: serine/threonine protein kinase [Deltaproteobacteria bacterium]|nr:serine/threonine protein kinase [Deltaproteobacteria bacterium]
MPLDDEALGAWGATLPGLAVGARLGSGAFGAVLAAEHPVHGPVALKVLRPGATIDPEAFRSVAAIEHPNLLRLFGHGEHAGRAFLIMERIDGRDLLSAVRPPRPPIDPSKVRATIPLAFGQPVQEGGGSVFAPIHREGLDRLVPALRQLAAALVALHGAAKVHRDVRPENVLVTRDGRVVLVDYGLLIDVGEEIAADLPLRGAARPDIAGAPAYMAPDDEPSPAADWYAFGVLLFEALTGALPFAGNAHEVVIRKRTVLAPSPSFVVDLPDDRRARALDELCIKLLRRAVRLRAGAEEVARVFEEISRSTDAPQV